MLSVQVCNCSKRGSAGLSLDLVLREKGGEAGDANPSKGGSRYAVLFDPRKRGWDPPYEMMFTPGFQSEQGVSVIPPGFCDWCPGSKLQPLQNGQRLTN